MDRVGGDVGSAGGERGGAVALVDVAVDDEDAEAVLLSQADCGDCKVVEHAIAGARVGERVVAAAGGVGGEDSGSA